jgi:glycerate-2-kinase
VTVYENERTLCDHGNADARADMLAVGAHAVGAVHPENTIPSHVTVAGSTLDVDGVSYDLGAIDDIYVVGAGKGASHLVSTLRTVLGEHLTGGVVVDKHGQGTPVPDIVLHESGHPIPDDDGRQAGDAVTELAETATADDLVFACITGGASAQLTAPPDGVSVDDLAALTETLLTAGLPIHEINTVRKHVSEIKGGRLTRLVDPARLVTLVLVDEVAGEPWGPTVGDDTTFADAVAVLRRHGLWTETPAPIRDHLRRGTDGTVPETPAPDALRRPDSRVVVLGDATDLCDAAAAKAAELGYDTRVLSSVLEGESREVGVVLAGIAAEIARRNRPLEPPCVLVSGGETTVTVGDDPGRGGPNQELAVRFVTRLDGLDGVTLLSLGTDGTDGPTTVAGGLVDDGTHTRAADLGIDLSGHVARHDTTAALERLGDAVVTGATGTNVMDLRLLAVR